MNKDNQEYRETNKIESTIDSKITNFMNKESLLTKLIYADVNALY